MGRRYAHSLSFTGLTGNARAGRPDIAIAAARLAGAIDGTYAAGREGSLPSIDRVRAQPDVAGHDRP